MQAKEIKDIKARLILDSRGNPTIEADVILANNIRGRAAVPSGASRGDKEAHELRDKTSAWNGKGINNALANIDHHIKPALIGKSVLDIQQIDNIMIQLDGTNNKSKIGANAMLAVSLASVQAGALSQNKYLFEHIYHYIHHVEIENSITMPIPMMNILNGGSHADNNIDFQEFMIMPIQFSNFPEALQAGVEIFHSLKAILQKHNYSTSIGDEGGFAPNLQNNEQAIELILEATVKANYTPGKDISLALDIAASEFYSTPQKNYFLTSENKKLSSLQLIEYYQTLCNQYPIVSIEDGLDQNDWDGWNKLNTLLGNKIQIVGDDLTVTKATLLKKAINSKAINAILIKLNQIGTFTETLDTIMLAQENNLGTIISHRSGETENTFIADLAVATQAGQIKTGSLCRTDRTAKYNQLLRIAEQAQTKAVYANKQYLGCEKNK